MRPDPPVSELVRRLRQVNARQVETIDRMAHSVSVANRRAAQAQRRVRALEAELQRRENAA